MTRKHPGPMGAPCAGCGAYLTMRDAHQRKAAQAHRDGCRPYAAYMAARTASHVAASTEATH